MDDRIKRIIVMQSLQLFGGNQSVENIKETVSILFSKYNKENIKMIVEKSIEMYCSLNKSIDEAGGGGWNIDALSNMTVIDLISTLGINHIRFIYTRSKSANQKLEKIKTFVEEMLNEFSKQLEEDSGNLLAEFGINVYKEIIDKLDNY